MKQFYGKIVLFGLLMMFCVMFGVSLASTGVERIQGPVSPALAAGGAQPLPTVKPRADAVKAASAGAAQKNAAQQAGKSATAQAQGAKTANAAAASQGASAAAVPDKDTSMNRVGNKLGELLQIMAHHGIRSMISLFDAALGR